MEVEQKVFHQALLEYFEKLHKEMGRGGWTAENVENIVQELRSMVDVEKSGKTPKEIIVTVGHDIGPFGFKIDYVAR